MHDDRKTNEALARGIYRSFLRNDLPAVLDALTEEVVLGNERDTARATDRRFDQQWVQFLTLGNGKVARFRQFPDTAAVGAAFASA